MIKGLVERTGSKDERETSVDILLPFCNLRCPYCHAHELVLNPEGLETLNLEDALARLESMSDRVDTVCLTGGEPTLHRDLPAILEALQGAGFRTRVETNGTQPNILDYLIARGRVDSVAMDVKAPLEDEAYERCAGVSVPVTIIQETLAVLARAKIEVLLRCTVCPSLLTEADVQRLAQDLKHLWVRVTGDPTAGPVLALQPFIPDDPLVPSLKAVTPFSEKELSLMQDRVDAILSLS
jgi:pyruvate formate lyase activating enzyme